MAFNNAGLQATTDAVDEPAELFDRVNAVNPGLSPGGPATSRPEHLRTGLAIAHTPSPTTS